MQMPHKFDANASNLVLMSKKTGGEGYNNFIFSKIMFYIRLEEHHKNLREEPLAFFFNKLVDKLNIQVDDVSLKI
jgi:hypothetical protein